MLVHVHRYLYMFMNYLQRTMFERSTPPFIADCWKSSIKYDYNDRHVGMFTENGKVSWSKVSKRISSCWQSPCSKMQHAERNEFDYASLPQHGYNDHTRWSLRELALRATMQKNIGELTWSENMPMNRTNRRCNWCLSFPKSRASWPNRRHDL